MHYTNPRNRQKRCIRKHKLIAIHRFIITPDFDETVPIVRALSHPFWQKSERQHPTDAHSTAVT